MNATQPLSISEDTATGTIINHFTGTDPDAGDSLTFSLIPKVPSQLSPTLWVDASDTNTIEIGVVASRNGRTKAAIAAILLSRALSSRPASGSRTQNGLNVLDFDGSDSLRSGQFSLGEDFSIFIGAKIDSINEYRDSIFSFGNSQPRIPIAGIEKY